MRNMGFGPKRVNWITIWLHSTKIAVLTNGETEKEIVCKRDLMQGDPLSPLLFVLVAEGLNLLFAQMKESGKIAGLPASRMTSFTNLQYADDTLIFGHCNVLQACAIKWTLNCFEACSDLRINYHKSFLTLTCQESVVSKMIVGLFGCRETKFSILYLGIPIKPDILRKSDWDPIIERAGCRLKG